MYLKRITIRNFRIFDEKGIDVFFNPGVNAIIGENNSGKSTLIDAIRIAFSTVSYNKDIYFTKNDFHVNNRGEKADSALFDIYLKDVPKNLIEIWNPGSDDSGEFHLKFYVDTAPSGAEKIRYKAWGGQVEGNSLSSDTFDAINVAFLGALRNAENEMRPSRFSKLANLLNSVTKDDDERESVVAELRRANREILSKKPIQKAKEIINKNLADIEQDLLQQQIDIGLVDPKFESISGALRSWIIPKWYYFTQEMEDYEFLVSLQDALPQFIHSSDDGIYVNIAGILNNENSLDEQMQERLLNKVEHLFELSQNGLGYNNLLFMSTVLGDMSQAKDDIYLNLFTVEEPEAHLHPQLQELIHNFFERKYLEAGPMQVIYTTHSPTLVSRIGLSSINLLFENNHSIYSFPLDQADLTTSEKAHLEKYLDVTKSQMFFAKGVLFVEGISEAMLIPEMAKLLDRPFDKYAVEVVNIDGTAFAPFAKILTVPTSIDSVCFAKSAIITDDDRCTNPEDKETYISKELDYNCDRDPKSALNQPLDDLVARIKSGQPSDRFSKIQQLCSSSAIKLCPAKKTFEYELALLSENINYILETIITLHSTSGKKLKNLVDLEADINKKALRIWLFIQYRNSLKGEIAQELSRRLRDEYQKKNEGEGYIPLFKVPAYIEDAIYAVTEPKNFQ